MNKRIEWLDVSKFIAIAIMILGHLGLPNSLSNLIHIFHMPIFFLLAGLCFDMKKYNKFSLFVASRAKSLLVPYFFWGIVMYTLWYFVPYFKNLGGDVEPFEFIVSILTYDATKPLFGSFGVLQWFFTSLFGAELVMWIIIKFVSKFSKKVQMIIYVIFCGLLMILSNICTIVLETNPLGLVSSLFGAVMCITGYVSKEFVLKANEEFSVRHVFSGIISFGLLIVVWIFNGSTNMRIVQYNNIILYYIGALSGSIFIFCISVLFVKLFFRYRIYRAILYLGQNTAIILCFNRLVQWTIIKWINGTFSCVLENALAGFIYQNYIYIVLVEVFDLLIEMVCYIPIAYLVNRWLPFSIGRKQIRGNIRQ